MANGGGGWRRSTGFGVLRWVGTLATAVARGNKRQFRLSWPNPPQAPHLRLLAGGASAGGGGGAGEAMVDEIMKGNDEWSLTKKARNGCPK